MTTKKTAATKAVKAAACLIDLTNTVTLPSTKQMMLTAEPVVRDSLNGLQHAIAYGDLIRVSPLQTIAADGISQRSQIQPPGALHLATEIAKVIRRVRRLKDGQLHRSYDEAGYQCEGIVKEADLLRRRNVAGLVPVVLRNGRDFHHSDGATPRQSRTEIFPSDENLKH